MADNELMNMQGIKEKIVDRVKVSFFELLPEEKFQELVDKEIKDFFEATVTDFKVKEYGASYRDTSYTLSTPVSPFRAIIWEECNKIVRSKLDGVFSTEGMYTLCHTIYDQQGNVYPKAGVSDALKELLEAQATKLASTFFESMFAQAFDTVSPLLIQNIKNGINQQY